MTDIDREYKCWEEQVLGKVLAKGNLRKKSFQTPSGIEIDHLSLPFPLDYLKQLGFPGEYPFTRGVQPTMYRGRLWTMRQYAGMGDAEESNKRYRYLLEQGQTGLSCAFDLPTQIGYDSDHPLALGEVGRVGVAIDSSDDMERLFHGIPLAKVTTSMTINSPAAILLAMYVAVAEKNGLSTAVLGGTTQNDILKEYVARGTYIFPPLPSLRLVVDLIEYCARELPQWNPISISGYHIREAGATAVQELAFTLADGIAYVEHVLKRGIAVDSFAPRLSFFFAVHNNFFEEIAKFRAARRMWARIMKERFRAKDQKSMALRFHTQTGGVTLTYQQPRNNIVRVALQAMAAVIGGTQSLHTNSWDEAISLPSEEAVKIALRTQEIIARESGAADAVDPLAGSYYLEKLTDRIEEEAGKYISRIDGMGGMLSAIESGFVQDEIRKSAYLHQRKVESGEEAVVGVNVHREDETTPQKALTLDPAVEERQKERLQRLKAARDDDRVREALGDVRKTARTSENLLPAILQAVKVYCTVGEICGVLREEFGEYRETTTV
ncbi:MAG: methylmalonyl-CoA mutase family protein [Candidatus Aureabacteria bacterium]|nr:methylmalonyl-CoA mutase family protein [Candidatus Auribacterota bacterium]